MSKHRTHISVCVPIHDMENGAFFLDRLKDSLARQTFTDFEVVITNEGKMAENTNAAIKQANGKIIKILYMDDYLYSDDALKNLVTYFDKGWFASGCVHDDGQNIGAPHYPSFFPNTMENRIGSPSVIAFENDDPLLFDETLSWMLDVELYMRLYERYGFPTMINQLDVAIGIHPGQMTNILSDVEKTAEVQYVHEKHGTH